MAHLFTYGSLMFDEVWSKLVTGNYTSSKATLEGYARRCVVNEDYPVIFIANESVQGIVYHDISDEDMKILDTFEGEFYERKSLHVNVGNAELLLIEAYVLKEDYFAIIDDRLWSEEDFSKEGMTRFIDNYKGFLS